MRFAPILAALRADAGSGPLRRHRRRRAVRLRARRPGLARRAPSATCAGSWKALAPPWLKRPRFAIREIELFERPVVLRLPFRFGVVTLTECPQAFARARIEFADGSERLGRGGRADGAQVVRQEPGAVSNEDNFDQLRDVLRLARDAYLRDAAPATAFGHFARHHDAHLQAAARRAASTRCWPSYGPALLDRAVLDALCRALRRVVLRGDARNLAGIGAGAARVRAAATSTRFLPALAARPRASRRATPSAWSTPSPRPT